jgi:aquaporin Z
MSEKQQPQQSGQAQPMSRSVAAMAEALGVTQHSLHERLDFENTDFAWRRLFSELFGTFLLVFVAAGGGIVNARFGGHAVPLAARVVAPGVMVMSIILFMGGVSGAHLNPVVSIAFALRRDFAWRRVPGYIVAQFAGGLLATELLVALLGKQGGASLTLPGTGISTTTALVWEIVLTAGLVSVILGTSSGAQSIGWGAAIGVGGYIALAGLIGAPVSGASMNPVRSLAPVVIVGVHTAWWAYLVGPLAGALVAVGIAWALRGSGGGLVSRRAASGTLGDLWRPGGTVPLLAHLNDEHEPVAAPTATSPGNNS